MIYIDYTFLQPELNLEWDSEHRCGKGGVSGSLIVEWCGRKCFWWQHDNNGRWVGIGVTGIILGTGSGNGTGNGSGNGFGRGKGIIGIGIRPGKGIVEPDKIFGNLLKTSDSESNGDLGGANDVGGFGTRDDPGVVSNVASGFNDEGVVFETDGDNRSLHKRLIIAELLVEGTFGFIIGAGAGTDDLFGNILNTPWFNADDFPLELEDRNGFEIFGIGGGTGVVFTNDWADESDDDKGGGVMAEWYNKCLIKCFIKAEL